MSKTYQVETEDEFFERMRTLARKVDRQEFVGGYENSSFQSKEEMLQASSSDDDDAEAAKRPDAGHYVFFRRGRTIPNSRVSWVPVSNSDNPVHIVMNAGSKVNLEGAALRVHVISGVPAQVIVKRDQLVK